MNIAELLTPAIDLDLVHRLSSFISIYLLHCVVHSEWNNPKKESEGDREQTSVLTKCVFHTKHKTKNKNLNYCSLDISIKMKETGKLPNTVLMGLSL